MTVRGKKGVQHLQAEVLAANACTSCGTCVGLCPYIKAARDRVTVIHDCGLTEGVCYQVCPRGETDLAELDSAVFGEPRSDHLLGHHTGVLMARSLLAAVRQRGQYGGVVSTLAILAREASQVDALVMTGSRAGPVPEGRLAWSNEEILACAGSKYAAAPSMAALNRALALDSTAFLSRDRGPAPDSTAFLARDRGLATTKPSLGVVGRPCQITGLRKLQAVADNPAAERVKLAIGLFCFWALSFRFHDLLAKLAPLSTISKVDIPPGGLVLQTTRGTLTAPLDDIRAYIKPACDLCFDVTAELADVSVGATEFDPEWNTLLPRTNRGQALVDKAVADRLLEVKPLPPDRVAILREVVRAKKARVLKALAERGDSYLKVGDDCRTPILEGGGADEHQASAT